MCEIEFMIKILPLDFNCNGDIRLPRGTPCQIREYHGWCATGAAAAPLTCPSTRLRLILTPSCTRSTLGRSPTPILQPRVHPRVTSFPWIEDEVQLLTGLSLNDHAVRDMYVTFLSTDMQGRSVRLGLVNS